MMMEDGAGLGDGARGEGGSSAYGPGLKLVRKRRWFLWGVIGIYIPVMWLTLRLTNSMGATAPVFAVWFIFLCVAAGMSAVARCPACGNYFHMHGMTLLYLRRCLHCGLHVKADKKTEN